jgi:hypothetical protein
MDEGISRIPAFKSLKNFLKGVGRCHQLTFIKPYPFATVELGALLEPLVRRARIRVPVSWNRAYLEGSQLVVETPKLGMIRIQLKPLRSHLADTLQSPRIDDPPDLLDERLGSRVLRFGSSHRAAPVFMALLYYFSGFFSLLRRHRLEPAQIWPK